MKRVIDHIILFLWYAEVWVIFGLIIIALATAPRPGDKPQSKPTPTLLCDCCRKPLHTHPSELTHE